jgi:hypothetical protein
MTFYSLEYIYSHCEHTYFWKQFHFSWKQLLVQLLSLSYCKLWNYQYETETVQPQSSNEFLNIGNNYCASVRASNRISDMECSSNCG